MASRRAEGAVLTGKLMPFSSPTVANFCTSPTDKTPTEPWTDEITIGAHLEGPYDKIGHAFVGLKIDGEQKWFGLWPKNGFDLGAKKDRKGVIMGMEGAVLDDRNYPTKEGSVTKSFPISPEQYQAVLDWLEEFDVEQAYTLWGHQCATYALAILRASGNDIHAGYLVSCPTVLHRTISEEQDNEEYNYKKGDL